MYLTTSYIPATKELYELTSYDYSNQRRSLQNSYDIAMANPNCAFVIASAAVKRQIPGVDCLLANGFKQTSRPKRNPNSGSMIALFVKPIRKPRRRKKATNARRR